MKGFLLFENRFTERQKRQKDKKWKRRKEKKKKRKNEKWIIIFWIIEQTGAFVILNHSMKIIMLFVAIYKAEQNYPGLFFNNTMWFWLLIIQWDPLNGIRVNRFIRLMG